MNDLNIPRLMPTGVDPRYVASGANRTIPYHVWVEQKRRAAAYEGRKPQLPPTDRNGIPLDLAHYADPDEMVEMAKKIVARAEATDEERKRFAALEAEYGDEFKRAAASGDGAELAGAIKKALLHMRDVDPVMWPAVTPTPGDYTNEFGVPLDQTEIITLCEEVGLYNALPEITKGTKTESWLELDQLEFASGCDSCAFPAGECPEDQVHHSEAKSLSLKHFGVKKALTQSDIMDSAASIAAGYGINKLVGGFNQQGLPGELDTATLFSASIGNVKEKELRLAMILVLNCWDDLLVNGDPSLNPDEFAGIMDLITAANGARSCPTWMSGTFSVEHFDEFLAAGCASPQAIIGHPAALQEIAMGYMGLGYQFATYGDNSNVTPGIHFSNTIMSSLGPIALIGDTRFPRVDVGGGRFRTIVYPVRLTHNGEPLIYKRTQIPLSAKDLTPGCTAVAFEVWAVSALVVKAMCAQAFCEMTFSGIIDDSCNYVHPCTPALLRPQ
jgi:hypothetical protein